MSLADPDTSWTDSIEFLDNLPSWLSLPRHSRDEYDLAFLEWTIGDDSAFLISFSGERVFFFRETIRKKIWRDRRELDKESMREMAGRLAAFFKGEGD